MRCICNGLLRQVEIVVKYVGSDERATYTTLGKIWARPRSSFAEKLLVCVFLLSMRLSQFSTGTILEDLNEYFTTNAHVSLIQRHFPICDQPSQRHHYARQPSRYRCSPRCICNYYPRRLKRSSHDDLSRMVPRVLYIFRADQEERLRMSPGEWSHQEWWDNFKTWFKATFYFWRNWRLSNTSTRRLR